MFFDIAAAKKFLCIVSNSLSTYEEIKRLDNVMSQFPANRDFGTIAGRNGVLGLEVRLGESDNRVDVSVPVTTRDARELPNDFSNSESIKYPTCCSIWERLVATLAWWGNADDLLGNGRVSWLEFDIDDDIISEATKFIIPKIFFQLGSEYRRPLLMQGSWQKIYITQLSKSLLPQEPQPSLMDSIANVGSTLPRPAFLKHIGINLNDSGAGVRLSIQGITQKSLLPFLRKQDWKFNHDPNNLISLMVGKTSHLFTPTITNIDIDSCGNIKEGIGVEFPIGPVESLAEDSKEYMLLKSLIYFGLCTEKKFAALLDVPMLPSESSNQDKIQTARKINHIKIQFDKEGPVEAKAYIGQTIYRSGSCVF